MSGPAAWLGVVGVRALFSRLSRDAPDGVRGVCGFGLPAVPTAWGFTGVAAAEGALRGEPVAPRIVLAEVASCGHGCIG
jgi:hypothetical protein